MWNRVMLRIAALAIVPFTAAHVAPISAAEPKAPQASGAQSNSSHGRTNKKQGIQKPKVSAQALSRAITTEPPKVITLDDAYLSLSRDRLKADDASLKPAYDALIVKANKALAAKLETVMDKSAMPLSGDKHDYISMGPYWWPNPNTSDKLPYIRKDGQVNPETKGDNMDSPRLVRMSANVRDLSLAYYFTGDKEYADRAAAAIRTWFLDPATRMNPNLRFGQSIPGVVDGRGVGVLDTRVLWMVIDGVALIQPSNALSRSEVQDLRKWFAQYVDWMMTSDTGHEEFVWHNNHGSFFDAQVADYLLFLGDTKGAARFVFDSQTRRIAAQIARDGKMWMELERTRPYHYTLFNLEALTHIARYGEQVNNPVATLKSDDLRCVQPQLRCEIDVWNFEVDERSLKRGIDFFVDATANPNAWTMFTKEEKSFEYDAALPVLLMAERAYKNGAYAKVLETFPDDTKASLDRLLWPLK